MRLLQLTLIAGLMLTTACIEQASGQGKSVPNLHLWLHGVDDFVPNAIHSGKRDDGSAARLGEALRACGITNYTVETYGLAGEEVYFPSSGEDAIIVGCVARRVDFGFNAKRILPAERLRGESGIPIAPADVRSPPT